MFPLPKPREPKRPLPASGWKLPLPLPLPDQIEYQHHINRVNLQQIHSRYMTFVPCNFQCNSNLLMHVMCVIIHTVSINEKQGCKGSNGLILIHITKLPMLLDQTQCSSRLLSIFYTSPTKHVIIQQTEQFGQFHVFRHRILTSLHNSVCMLELDTEI